MIHLLGSNIFLSGLAAFIIALFIFLGILKGFFALICLILIPLILVQKGKGSMGIEAIGGSSQMLFGGSGGQNIFQKATWFLAACFMAGSLLLSLYTTGSFRNARILKDIPAQQQKA